MLVKHGHCILAVSAFWDGEGKEGETDGKTKLQQYFNIPVIERKVSGKNIAT